MRIKNVKVSKEQVNVKEKIVITFKIEYGVGYPHKYPYSYPSKGIKE